MIHIFIVNSLVTKRNFREKLKNHLEKRNDIRWFVFSTAHAGMEAEIALKMTRFFEGEKLRFYCCGGSGTFRNVFNAVKDYSDLEMAFYPCGATNDFLKVFGKSEECFREIDYLIDGRVEPVDYLKTNYGVALNTVSFGIDTSICSTLEKCKNFDIFGANFPSFLAYMYALLFDLKYKKYDLAIDGEEVEDELSEMIIGNGRTLGGNLHFTDEPEVKDGLFDYMMSSSKYNTSLIKIMALMTKEDFEGYRKFIDYGKASKMKIVTNDGRNIDMNLDGELVLGGPEWVIEIVKGGLSFVVPEQIKDIR